MKISILDTQEKILTKVLMLKGEKGDKGDAGELTNLDTELSTTSTNAVQNKVITKAFNELLENSATNAFTDGIDSLFKDVKANIQPVQAGSGTPSPTNVRAISGFTECTVLDRQINQWDEEYEIGSMNETGSNVDGNGFRSKNFIQALENTTYYFHKTSNYGNNIYAYFYDENKDYINKVYMGGSSTFTTVNGTKFIKFYIWGGGITYSTYYNDISINYPATDTSYHAYNGTTATISFGSAGTVYGGEVDLTTGVLTVDRTMVDLGSLSWSLSNTPSMFYSFGVVSTAKANGNILSPIYMAVAGSSAVLATDYSITVAGDKTLYAHNSTYSTASDFKTAMNGVQLVYELATPQTYQLTPTQLRSLVGTNNLTSNTGDTVEVEYITNETIAWLLDLINA